MTHLNLTATLRAARRPLLLLATALAAGCASFEPQPGPGPEPEGHYADLTLPVIALGDTQEHESTGYPLHDNDSAVDAYVEVAQRPPEQPLFGRRILEWVLRRHPGAPVIHLGDVLDLSCRSEAARIGHILRDMDGPGAILPGNHDGLMFGIYGYRILDAVLDPDARRWNHACRRGAAPDDTQRKSSSEALSKRDFISLYLAQQAGRSQGAPGLPVPPAHGGFRVSWRHPDPQAFVSAIEANLLDGYAYADSFLAQRLKMPRAPGATRDVIVIGLDTNQAGSLVSTWDTIMGRSPGSMGHVHFEQITAVTKWVLEAARNGDIVVFAGHHNWRSLGLPTRLMLRNLMSNLQHPLVYLSAHTHRGFWATHRALDNRPLLELNVSSLSDWPIAYRRISFAYDERAARLLVRGELMPNADRPIHDDAGLLAAWEAEACARIGPEPDAFVRFDREVVQRQRGSRGSLLEWLVESLAAVCETCEQPLYQHAQAYQDAMLDTILQLASHLGTRAHALHEVQLPAWCGPSDFHDCAQLLKAEQPADFAAHVALFRRKAQLVDMLGSHLDDLKSPQAEAYMTCRAVQAARIDFELTDDARNSHRGEAKRRSEQFFRIEASVGNE
ncbi:hypothetical protein [uncultured Piscinibacter sp.]|uniref:hypothetical protein n=1 Tax=uncultured Piscinibacter sp. TaxID=1131835 RepID=UPI0026272AC3|nr:hypothetical protein [uncultured Piscinibacter sp.]